MSTRIPQTDIRGKRATYLLDLKIGGRPFRFAERRLDIQTEAGDTIRYSEGLGELELPVVFDGAPTVTITISSDVDWALLVAEGNTIELATAVLRRHFAGQTLERARVHLSGDVEDPSYDRKGADLEFTLIERPLRLSAPLIRPHHRIDSETWPITAGPFSLDEKSGEGRPYGWVFGYPGELPSGTVVAAVPVPCAEFRSNNSGTRHLLGHGEMEATGVELFKYTEGKEQATRPVVHVRDLKNTLVASATLGNTTLRTAEAGQLMYAGFSIANGGGLLRRDRTGALRGAGEITRYVMERFVRGVDLDSRFDAVEDKLNQWKIDTYIDGEDLNWWQWLTQELWAILPVVRIRTADGMYLEVIDFAAEPRDAVAELNADRRSISRIPGVQSIGGDSVANQITLKYCPKRDSGKFHETLTVSAEPGFLRPKQFGDGADRRILANVFCRHSQTLYRLRREVRSTHLIWDRATAGLTLGWWAARDAIPRRRVRYIGSHSLESIPPWKPILLTDSQLHLEDVVAYVEPPIAGASEDEVSIIIQDHPHIGSRSTA